MIESVNRQNKIVHYGLWIIAFVVVALASGFFTRILNEQVWQPVPSGYRFSVSDHASKDTSRWNTYYIYDNQIIVYREFPDENAKHSPATIYDNINTSTLVLDEKALAESCDQDACYRYPKVLDQIKALLANRINREFLRP